MRSGFASVLGSNGSYFGVGAGRSEGTTGLCVTGSSGCVKKKGWHIISIIIQHIT